MTIYTAEIRTTAGEHLGSVNATADRWKGRLTSEARRLGLEGTASTRAVMLAQHFPVEHGSPVGTYHVQFGTPAQGGQAMSLGKRYVVAVYPRLSLP